MLQNDMFTLERNSPKSYSLSPLVGHIRVSEMINVDFGLEGKSLLQSILDNIMQIEPILKIIIFNSV